MHNQMFLQSQQNYANDYLIAHGYLFLNDVYDLLGLERTQAGQVVGWVRGKDGGDGYVDFGIFENDTVMGKQFAMGNSRSILLDFNVDGVVWDLIPKSKV
jgi:hypothetical protein